jgi:ribosomal protein S18 acetylase RimI-like enzyme
MSGLAPPVPGDRLGLAAPLFRVDGDGPWQRLSTPFALPDGDLVALFLRRHSDPPLLSDLGETLRWLRSHTTAARRSERQQEVLAETCAALGVELRRGALQTLARPGEPLARAAVRLVQACLRAAELWRTLRPRAAPAFVDEVEAFLRAHVRARPLDLSRGERVAGISAASWSVDLRLRAPDRHLLVFLLASERRVHARKLAEHVVAACIDLAHLRKLRRPVEFVVVFDDRGEAWSDAEARLVAPFAAVHRWTARDQWAPSLADPALPDDPDDADDPGPIGPEDFSNSPARPETEVETDAEPDAPREVEADPVANVDADPDPDDTAIDARPGPDLHTDVGSTPSPSLPAFDPPTPLPPMSLHTRPARPDDHSDFARLFPELGVDDPVPDAGAWAAHQCPTTVMLEDDGEVVGYVYYEVMGDLGYVRNVVVDPGFRRRGLGLAAMLDLAARLRARGCTRWCLNVRPDNAPALALYRAVGMTTAYRSAALRFAWAVVDALAQPDMSFETCPIDPAEDDAIAAAFALPPGQLAGLRAHPRRVHLRLRDPADPGAPGLGFASFDPEFPGAYPFRVARAAYARPLLAALRPYALPDRPYMQIVAEDDDELTAALLAAGAQLRLEILHLRGALP